MHGGQTSLIHPHPRGKNIFLGSELLVHWKKICDKFRFGLIYPVFKRRRSTNRFAQIYKILFIWHAFAQTENGPEIDHCSEGREPNFPDKNNSFLSPAHEHRNFLSFSLRHCNCQKTKLKSLNMPFLFTATMIVEDRNRICKILANTSSFKIVQFCFAKTPATPHVEQWTIAWRIQFFFQKS